MHQGDALVAITGVGIGLPELRLDRREVNAAWGHGGGRGAVAVCGPDEDVLTLSWHAADSALGAAGVTASAVDGLWWGTSRPPFAEGPSGAYLAAALGLRPDLAATVVSGSTTAGLDALVAARDAVASGRVRTALVVAADDLRPALGGGLETAAGSAAVAYVLAAGDHPATLGPPTSRWMPALDRYRGDGEDGTRDAYDGRLFREQIFLPLLADLAKELTSDGPTRWSLPHPDGRLGAALARRIGATEVPSASVAESIGDSGCASAMLGAVASIGTPGRTHLVAYGGGRATGLTCDVTAAVPGGDVLPELLAAGRPVTYTEVLRARGQLRAQGESVEMAVPPGSAMFVRENLDLLAGRGARCLACGTVNIPPGVHPSCITCGGDAFEAVTFARRGTVVTFVVNQTMPAPFLAPLPLVVVQLDDGARVQLQGLSSAADGLRIGAPVELILRRYSTERGVPLYGWKVALTDRSRP